MTVLRAVGSVALRRPALPLLDVRELGAVAVLAPLSALLAVTLFLRTRDIHAGFWIDEGLSVGIATHSLLEIPGLLVQDGSPPLYYLLLHVWLQVAGTSEAATHSLSLLFAALAVPVGLWAGWTLFGARAGWICAALATLNPFITLYAQETRMYALMVTLSLVAAGAFVHAFAFGRRRYLVLFAAVLTVMLYTHNWALFFTAAAAMAVVPCLRASGERRALARDGLVAFGAAGLLFAPWLPTLLAQVQHTRAPWANAPPAGEVFRDVSFLLGGDAAAIAILMAAGTGLAAVHSRRESPERTAIVALAVLVVATLALGWVASQVSPAWTTRYLAVIMGPLLLLAALGFARAGRFGIVALALVLVLWVDFRAGDTKSNVREVATASASRLAPGDVVVSTHPEQIPVLRYYLPDGLRYTTSLGTVTDPGVMDWRDALDRLRGQRAQSTLAPLLDRLPPGRRLLFVRPVTTRGGWSAPWTRLVRQRSAEWRRVIAMDDRFASDPVLPLPGHGGQRHPVRAVVYEKVAG